MSRSTIKAIGKSKLLLNTQVISLLLSLLFVCLFLRFDIEIFVWVIVFDAVISYSIVGFCIGKYLNYSLFRQVADWGGSFIVSMVVAYITSIVATKIHIPMIAEVIIFFVLNTGLYFITSILLKNDIATMAINVIKNKVNKKTDV